MSAKRLKQKERTPKDNSEPNQFIKSIKDIEPTFMYIFTHKNKFLRKEFFKEISVRLCLFTMPFFWDVLDHEYCAIIL